MAVRSSLKEIDFSKDIFIHKNVGVTTAFENVLKSSGNHLKTLKLCLDKHYYSYKNDEPPNNFFQLVFGSINKYSTGLTNLKIQYSDLSDRDLDHLSDSVIQDLKSLDLERMNMGKISEQKLASVLKTAVNLEEFSLESCNTGMAEFNMRNFQLFSGLTGYCLLNLSRKCKALTINCCHGLDNNTIAKVFEVQPQIENLDLSYTNIEPEALIDISKRLQLVSLSLISKSTFFEGQEYKLLQLEKLRKLEFTSDEFNEEILDVFIEKCPLLEELNLMCYYAKIKDEGFANLQKLKNLRKLTLDDNHITDKTLIILSQELKKLEQVSCRGCKHLTESGLIEFITFSEALKYLDLEDSKYYTSDFFSSVAKIVEGRPNKIILTILLYCPRDKLLDEMERLKLEKLEGHRTTCRIKFSDWSGEFNYCVVRKA